MDEKMINISERRRKRLFIIFTAMLFLWSLSIALMPFGTEARESNRFLLYLNGALFWIGMLGTVITAVYIGYRRRRSAGFHQSGRDRPKLGLVHFFQNKEAAAADIAAAISLIGFLIVVIFFDSLKASFIFLSLCLFTFGMHCMLNGTDYKYIKYQIRRH